MLFRSEPYSVGMLIIPLACWAVILTLDPVEKSKLQEAVAQQQYLVNVANARLKYYQSPEGLQKAQDQAVTEALLEIEKISASRVPTSFFGNNGNSSSIPATPEETRGLFPVNPTPASRK